MRDFYEKFAKDYRLHFRTFDEIDFYDIFEAGAKAHAQKVLAAKPRVDLSGFYDIESFGPVYYTTRASGDFPEEIGWYTCLVFPYEDVGDRYFDGTNWYRQGSLHDERLKNELCLVGEPYSWRRKD